ncbi:C25 family cysteine peptidase [Kordia sp. SMS9]|uniref:C25 family cysteine peptidase n=1 Tax=Kordia sp. SMS9 TaxID=2282170 RepID=UPI0013B3C94C|nr:C25 family cysteine peptidase [Kordia sp. SMS9]
MYCPSKGFYQIADHFNEANTVFSIPKVLKIEERNHYKYSLPNSFDSSHWFLAIISEDNPFRKKLFKGIPVKNTKEYVKLKLYNFKKSDAPILVKINGKQYRYSVPYGEFTVSVPVISTEKYVDIEVSSFFYEVGIEHIEMKLFEDKRLLLSNDFEKYVFRSFNTIQKMEDAYAYATFDGATFKKVEHDEKIKNLIFQKASTIQEVALYPSTIPSNTYHDFLVVYNARHFDANDLALLTKLLKRIDPNLSYVFVDSQEIYNAYSHSSPSAKAIKKHIHKVLPKHVLFLGDASEKEDEGDLIPTHYYIQDKDFTRVETDYPYSYLNDPSSPKISVGRLPFKTSSELNAYIQKVTTFLDKKKKSAYAIYDDISIITSKLDVFYTSYEKQNSVKKYLGMHTIPSYINDKNPSVFQFVGHASYTGWSKNKKVAIDDMESLTSGNMFVLIDLSCWTGTFAYHKRDCFAENLLKMDNKGAIVSISASGYTHIDNYNSITEYFVSKRGKPIGNVLKQLKKELFKQNKISLDDLHAYNLIGIPTLTY